MKNFYFLLILCLLAQPIFAKTIPVESLKDFSTEHPTNTFSVKVLDELTLDKNITLQSGDILDGEIVDVKNAKRLKRNATFTFVPEYLTKTDGQEIKITGYHPAKYTQKLNKVEIAKDAALTVGNHFVQGISMGYKTIEGVVKNEQNNRLKSGANALYESTPLSYIEKGKEIIIPKNQNFLLNFKTDKPATEPNYEYQELD